MTRRIVALIGVLRRGRRWLRRRGRQLLGTRRLPPADAPKRPLLPSDATKVHVGAGPVRLDGWANTDLSGKADYYLDATGHWPATGVTHVFADNVIEHLTLDGARAFLREARAAMTPGGRIRLVTPDAEASARAYIDRTPDLEALIVRHRMNGYAMAHPADVLRVVFSLNGHHNGYVFDLASMRAELEAAGFVNVERVPMGESSDPELRGIDSRTEPIDDLLLLTVEAERP